MHKYWCAMMACNVYFPFPKVLYLYQRNYAHILSIFKKPKTGVLIFDLLNCSNIYNLQQNLFIFV